MISQLASGVTDATRPKEVVSAAGAWLGGQLASAGFRWMTDARHREVLHRERGARTEEILLESMDGNRAGRQIRAHLGWRVHDRDLKAWRQRHSSRVCFLDDYLIGYSLDHLPGDAGSVELRDPASRIEALTAFAETIHEHMLPIFDAVNDPDLTARTVPSYILLMCGGSVIEWLASQNRPDLVTVVLDRMLTTYPSWRSDFEQGRQSAAAGRRVAPDSLNGQTYGWLAAKLGDSAYQPPAEAAPPPAPTVYGAPVNTERPLQKPDGTPMTIVVTGRFEDFTRDEAHIAVDKLGGRVTTSVSADTDMVIAGRRSGTKAAEAAALGVPTMTSETFSYLYNAHHKGAANGMARILAHVLERAD